MAVLGELSQAVETAASSTNLTPLENSLIADHVHTYHSSEVWVADTQYKGRVLVAARDYEAGEQVLLEYPLVEVTVDTHAPAYQILCSLADKGYLELPPLFYWAALNSLTGAEAEVAACSLWPTISAQTQAQALELQHESPHEACAEASASIKNLAVALWPPGRGPDLHKLERLLQVWIYNSFDQGDSDDGLQAGVIYLAASMCSHSCSPNAAWHLDDNNHWILQARDAIEEGEELTIPYLGPDDLCLPTPDRREILERTKAFFCQCDRCTKRLDGARAFRCPHCDGKALATTAKAPGAEGEASSSIECLACGSIDAEAGALLLAAEAKLRPWARARPEFHSAPAEVDVDCERSSSSSSMCALDLLSQAEDAGLGSEHWAIDALRAAIHSEDAVWRSALLRQRVAAHVGLAHAVTKCARLQLSLATSLLEEGGAPALEEAAAASKKAADTLAVLFGDDHPEHHEAVSLSSKIAARRRITPYKSSSSAVFQSLNNGSGKVPAPGASKSGGSRRKKR